jgi:ABC-2 type transport system permease protein
VSAAVAVWLVARREVATRLRDRGFRTSVAVMVLVVLAVVLLPPLLARDRSSFDVALVGASSQRLGPGLAGLPAQGGPTVHTRTYPDERAALDAVRAGRVDAAVVDGERVVSDGTVDATLAAALQSAHRRLAVLDRLRAQGVDQVAAATALDVVPLREVVLDTDSAARRGVALLVVVVLFGQLVGYGNWIASGVVEEKSSRVVELLLAALRPWQLLAGKILGIGALALAQLLVVTGAGFGVALAAGTVHVPAGAYGVVAQSLGWFVLAFAFYASAYAAAAALVSRQEQLGNVTGPMTLVLTASYFAATVLSDAPGGTLARVASVVPPFSALSMPTRTAAGPVPGWEVALAVALMLAATAALVRLAGRIYAGAVLRTGARVRVREALRAAAERSATPGGCL